MVDKVSPSKMISKDFLKDVNTVSCNGVNIAQFARQAGNVPVAEKLDNYRLRYGQIIDIAAQTSGTINVIQG